ncbi:hypothetical protein CDL15_Pgr004933 [Punica granatum]|uniref:BHLH domain-containing protein n=1 Tax=Punica granatum TaxID=22663 RepID=A0A218WWX1_PUNGR|nr:hypothetical protein CDL15_Pgr004933 [Punica granatum]PKI70236.1 hypothetical protein CRG98_009368 [Punica granatum]
MESNSSNPIGMDVHSNGQLPNNCFFNPSWENSISMDQTDPFESALSSIVSSPVASTMGPGEGDHGMIKELIGRLGVICNSGEISPQSYFEHRSSNNSTNTSAYTTPLNSPPKLSLSMMDHQIRGNFWMPGTQFHPHSQQSFVPFSTDPGFAERAARSSCFGVRNFAGGLQLNGSQRQAVTAKKEKVLSRDGNSGFGDAGDSREGSSLSEQIPGVEMNNMRAQNDANARKRKSAQRGKPKDSTLPPKDSEVAGENNQPSPKKIKSGEAAENGSGKECDENADKVSQGDKNQKLGKDSKSKQPEPPKDYIHVRARRGQATDSHSLAERVRREKISQRMKVLQDLVPGCNKVTGKAVMLDEIINYVQSLQCQVEFLSMKLATLNPRMDFNVEAFLSKDIFQSRGLLAHSDFPLDSSSAPTSHYGFQPSHGMISAMSEPEVQYPENPLNAVIHRNRSNHLPPIDGFPEASSQMSAMWEDDLQSVVQMGIAQNHQPLSFHGSAEPNHPQMKVKS